MKKFNLSLVAVLAMSTFAIAGGDIAPVEPEVTVETPMVENTDQGFYLGLGYGFLQLDRNIINPGVNDNEDFGTGDYDQIMLQAGYKMNSYLALEGRYWLGMGDNSWASVSGNGIQSVAEIDSWGIYAKPMYPVTEAFDVYALLGYANTDISITNSNISGEVDGFSWGIGASYDFTENFSVFADYTVLYDDNYDVGVQKVEDQVNVTTVGVSYKF